MRTFTSSNDTILLLDCPTRAEEKEETKNILYHVGVGTLLWTSNTTRSDIEDTVHPVATCCENSGQAHWKVVLTKLECL